MYFKQYGAQRTGTNYLKRLVELNFKNVTVFGSVLGWKHGMFETGNGYQHKCDSHKQWVDDKTKSGDVYSVDQHRLKYTPQELHDACERLNYLISIKNPHAYVVSYKRFRAKNQPWNARQVEQWLQHYLNMYSTWRQLYDKHVDTSIMIEYEQLLRNRDTVLRMIQSKFQLQSTHDVFQDEVQPVKASTDHGLLIDKHKQFDANYYLNHEYMNEIPDNMITLVNRILDQTQLMRC